ncbi:hypothetical protein Tcan_16644 [Toxocara canis]|uniref:Uncharacterized protein n=1 Tax=Toxocara canis TaxID=6265 RepID=A0A0B2VLE3_TOXCA|nr:hypothetical protein Tcan_16644 [Toxocara canis]
MTVGRRDAVMYSSFECQLMQVTRVGAVVNDIRKRMVELAPQLSKRCRALIKCWQKLADPRPTSSCGSHSNSVTPNLASPAIRKGLTPGTPARGRITSAALSAGSRSNLTSPAVGSPTGSYAPQQQNRCSPRNGAVLNLQKSYSLADLPKKGVEDALGSSSTHDDALRNGKRKTEHAQDTADSGLLNGFGVGKRSKSGSATASPAGGSHSVVAARRANVQPTSELVAQLSENLPRYMAINLIERENQLKREQQQQDIQQHGGMHPDVSSAAISSSDLPKKKERKGRYSKKASAEQAQNISAHTTKGAITDREKAVDEGQPSVSAEESEAVALPIRDGRYEWDAMLPTLDTLRRRDEFKAPPSDDPSKSYIVSVRGRKVLALPYVDVGIPDFVEYEYPQSLRFYADENFMYGAPRPT